MKWIKFLLKKITEGADKEDIIETMSNKEDAMGLFDIATKNNSPFMRVNAVNALSKLNISVSSPEITADNLIGGLILSQLFIYSLLDNNENVRRAFLKALFKLDKNYTMGAISMVLEEGYNAVFKIGGPLTSIPDKFIKQSVACYIMRSPFPKSSETIYDDYKLYERLQEVAKEYSNLSIEKAT